MYRSSDIGTKYVFSETLQDAWPLRQNTSPTSFPKMSSVNRSEVENDILKFLNFV